MKLHHRCAFHLFSLPTALAVAILAIAPLGTASAAIITNLTFVNDPALPDGPIYATVTVQAIGSGPTYNQVQFTVDAITSPSTFLAGTNFGIQKFAFNYGGLGTASHFSLPDDWAPKAPGNISEFGMFELKYTGDGSSRQDPLEFVMQTTDTFTSAAAIELAFKSLNNHVPPYHYAAHIAGFQSIDGKSSAWFGDGDGINNIPNPMPEPASLAAWGLGLAIAGLRARRRRKLS